MAVSNGHGRGGDCTECGSPQLARNNFFTGKLLAERDFVEEQQYLLGKDRRHQQALHGWGAVCGLRVKAHPDPACRRRYVVVEPGTAVDCCGREILVAREEVFAFEDQLPREWLTPALAGRDERHRLQICLRYAECPTEPVPALFDECACDEDGCLPNRILEAHGFDVRVDAPEHRHELLGPRVDWCATINVEDTWRIALDDAGGRLHVLTRTPACAPGGCATWGLTTYATRDLRQVAPTLGGRGDAEDVAVALDGSQLYVGITTLNGDVEIGVYEPGCGDPVNTLRLGCYGDAELELAPARGGRLYALLRRGGDSEVLAWDAPASDRSPADASGDLGALTRALAVAPDGGRALVAVQGAPELRMLDAGDLTTIAAASVDVAVSAMALRSTSAGLRLYAAREDRTFRVFHVDFADPVPVQPLTPALGLGASVPVAVAASEGGRYAYVLDGADVDDGCLRVVDTHRLSSTADPAAIRATLPLPGGRDLALAAAGRRLYAAYDEPHGDAAGVAVLEIHEAACAEIFERSVACCPACRDDDDCVVLATIDDYRLGEAIEDADIDNLRERRLLPSTTVITEVLRCLLDDGCGGGGERGAQGPPGLGINDVTGSFVAGLDPAGVGFDHATRVVRLDIPSIADVTGEFVDAEHDAGVELDARAGVVHLKVPRGPRGDRGPEGEPGAGVKDVTGRFVDGLQHAGVRFDATTRIVDLRLPSIAEVTAEVVETVAEAGVEFSPASGSIHLRVPKGDAGPAGSAQPLELPAIVALNWAHGGQVAPDAHQTAAGERVCDAGGAPVPPQLDRQGLVVAFDRDVCAETLTARTFRVWVEPDQVDGGAPAHAAAGAGAGPRDGGSCGPCPVAGHVTGLQIEAEPGTEILTKIPDPGADTTTGAVRGARFVPDGGWKPGTYAVELDGDFILGHCPIRLPDGREVRPALDADHLGPGLPLRSPTGDGVEGGTFRSWFTIA
jgi:hypothetical protein